MKWMSFLSFALLLGSVSQAHTIADVRTAVCADTQGSFLKIDVALKQVEGQFGSLGKMASVPNETPFEIMKGYPDAQLTAVGGLVIDSLNESWGTMALVAPSTQTLTGLESLMAFFTDMDGRAQTAQLDCRLGF